MTDQSTIGPDHIRRAAFVYIRQSSLAQVENNTEFDPSSVRAGR